MSSTSFGMRCFCIALLLAVCVASAAEHTAGDVDGTGEPVGTPIELTPAERADFASGTAFLVGAHGADARLRTFLGMNQVFLPEERWPAAQRVPVDRLAEQAGGSTDPFVLSILTEACTMDRLIPKPTCDAVDIARRWTVADTQNQVAWLNLAGKLRFAGDPDGAEVAFLQASRASMWHEFYDDGPRVVTAALPKTLGPRARIALQFSAMTSSAVWLGTSTAVQELATRCKDANMREACLRILDTIDRDGGTFFSKQMAASIGRRIGADRDTVARRWTALDLLQHAQSESGLKNFDEITDPAELARQAHLWDRRVALGELAWSKELADASGPAQRAAAERWHRERVAASERSDADERQRLAERARMDAKS